LERGYKGLNVKCKQRHHSQLIGMAFMFIEIAWMQRFSMFLGHPTYGFTVILFGLLLVSAIGSWAESFLEKKKIIYGVLSLWILVPLLILMDLGSGRLLPQTAGAEFAVRLAVTVAFIGVPAFSMGFYFPTGMTLAHEQGSLYAGWCWAINGALSVLGSVLAMLSCLTLGIHKTIWVGAGFYAAAALLFSLIGSGNGTESTS
jgi:hypothetical protein